MTRTEIKPAVSAVKELMAQEPDPLSREHAKALHIGPLPSMMQLHII